MIQDGIYIKGLHLKSSLAGGDYFRQIAPIRNLTKLNFDRNITFLIGENGSGKSTLLEAIAINFGINPEGGSKNYNFSTAENYSNLADYLVLHKSGLPARDTFLLRAESFFNVATYVEETFDDYSEFGETSLHTQSHGESFLNLIKYRFRGNGLYLLDEPEAALSPQRQLALLALLGELSQNNSQLIIATHSPILLAMPNATIYSFDAEEIEIIDYEDTPPYQTTKMILENREQFFHNLFND